ncbi:MAG TPA: hypothetical protein VGL82_05300 [Bryobacteraceae bacterium]
MSIPRCGLTRDDRRLTDRTWSLENLIAPLTSLVRELSYILPRMLLFAVSVGFGFAVNEFTYRMYPASILRRKIAITYTASSAMFLALILGLVSFVSKS